MNITKKNHYNPCFWTAYWNYEYYSQKLKNIEIKQKAREQKVVTLNLKSDIIIIQKTGQIFFEKNAGIADLFKDNILRFCQRSFPQKYDNLVQYFDKEPDNAIIDFENHFTEYENLYKSELEKTIITASIPNISVKTSLSFFLLTQLIRNHYSFNQIISLYESQVKSKFEFFIDIHNNFSNRDQLLKLLWPFLSSKWVLYKTSSYKFPLSDNPLLIRPFHIMIALAPDLMLEIDLKEKFGIEMICEYKDRISFHKYEEFKKRTIENSSKEIIFGNEQLLLILQKSKTYKNHLSKIENARLEKNYVNRGFGADNNVRST
jgi:hypothetical protein